MGGEHEQVKLWAKLCTEEDVCFVPSNVPFLLYLAPTRILSTPHVAQCSIIKPVWSRQHQRPFQMVGTEKHLARCHGVEKSFSSTSHNAVFPQIIEHRTQDADLSTGTHLLWAECLCPPSKNSYVDI